jgi:putative intracellular protease/amidase
MDIAILLFDGVTALDAVGPFEVLSRVPDARVRFVAARPGPVRVGHGTWSLPAEAALGEVPHPDILVVPGGPGQEALMTDRPVLEWVARAHETSRWTTSVCTGSLVLAGAGVLRGVRATTHWLALEALERLGAIPVRDRVVVDGKVLTAAGVSAGIDMALHLAARLCGPQQAQAIQLAIEYDPQPPFGAGSPSTAPPDVVAEARRRSRFRSP